MAEAFAKERLAARGFAVSSAGTRATLGTCTPDVLDVMGNYGFDVAAHRSRQLTPELLDAADLVIGLAREHVREAALTVPATLSRTFTLKEIVRRAERPRSPGDDLAPWLAELAAGRSQEDLLGAAPTDDIRDPIGQRPRVFEEVAEEIRGLVDELARLLVPDAAALPANDQMESLR